MLGSAKEDGERSIWKIKAQGKGTQVGKVEKAGKKCGNHHVKGNCGKPWILGCAKVVVTTSTGTVYQSDVLVTAYHVSSRRTEARISASTGVHLIGDIRDLR